MGPEYYSTQHIIIYCVEQAYVSTLAFYLHLFDFACRHAAVRSCFALCRHLFTLVFCQTLFVLHCTVSDNHFDIFLEQTQYRIYWGKYT